MRKLKTKLKNDTQGKYWWFINGKLLLADIKGVDDNYYYEIKL